VACQIAALAFPAGRRQLKSMKELPAIVRALTARDGREWVLATLVSIQGSSYRRPGARLLIGSDGTRIGSISGGCLEEDVLARARRVGLSGAAETVVYDTTSENDLVWGVGLGCHGVVRVLIEKLPPHPAWAAALAEAFAARRTTAVTVTFDSDLTDRLGTRLPTEPEPADTGKTFTQVVRPPVALVVFGAGDDAQPVARLAGELGWQVTIADPRPAFATRERFPTADAVVAAPTGELVRRTALDPDSVAVVMTHHYVHDVPLLRELLPLPLAYLGLLGPRKRAEKILADLARDGVAPTAAQSARLHAPIGLDIGADAPEQVALSIVAEIQSVLSGHNARPLRERTRPIHA
jgi:xanthine/CO dehydrogenase XdhC/CoxF family maturation factor